MSRHKKLEITGGYLAFPHCLLKRATELKLSGSQRRALDCAIYQGIGNEENHAKGNFRLGLGTLKKHGNMTAAEASRARDYLVRAGFIVQTKAEDIRHAKAAEYRLNLDSCENTTVVKSLRSEDEHRASTVQEPGSQLRNYNRGSCENTTAPLRNDSGNRCDNAIRDNITDNIPGFKRSPEDNNPPSPFEKGELGSAEKRVSESPSLSKPFTEQCSLSGDSVPLPREGTPVKADPRRLIKWFEADTNLQANVTETQMREYSELVAGCNKRQFEVCFVKLMKQIIGVPMPDHLQGPGEVFMLLAKAAANQADGNGALG
jgi:hypothetical protein